MGIQQIVIQLKYDRFSRSKTMRQVKRMAEGVNANIQVIGKNKAWVALSPTAALRRLSG
jgi:hypothetical protein